MGTIAGREEKHSEGENILMEGNALVLECPFQQTGHVLRRKKDTDCAKPVAFGTPASEGGGQVSGKI